MNTVKVYYRDEANEYRWYEFQMLNQFNVDTLKATLVSQGLEIPYQGDITIYPPHKIEKIVVVKSKTRY